MDIVSILAAFWWVIPIVLTIVLHKFILRLFGIIVIPEDKVGLVNKKFVLFGKNKALPQDRIIALNGEAGYQADTLAPGAHFWYWPWQYEVTKVGFIEIPKGKMGVVLARDGTSLEANRILAKRVECENFQDARKFLLGGGQRGRQSGVILSGTYRINTLLFEVSACDITNIPADKVGIITTKDGQPLTPGEIAGPPVVGHNNFQDFDKFVAAGGWRGLQQQVLLAGNWNLNPWAVSVEVYEMLNIPIGYVGVVNSFVGNEGKDVTGEEFAHGNIVTKGEKGVWSTSLDPGKYAINPFIMKVEIVPTTNIVLNWADARTEAHELDKNLNTITVRSRDGFTFNLDVSQIIHVPSTQAPKVIARFGSMKNLVSQVLEPTIGNYFRNSAQNSDVIGFLTSRSERQQSAREHIATVLVEYNVKAVDTLIGDITPPANLMETLTNRKLAQENKTTYEVQEEAQKTKEKLAKQTALADIQKEVVASEQGILIAQNNATSAIKSAEGAAKSIKLNAEADAERITVTGAAEASKIQKIGAATASAYEAQVKAMGPENFTRFQVVDKIASGKIRIMPDTLITGGSGNGGGNILESIMAMVLTQSKNLGAIVTNKPMEPAEVTSKD